MLRRPLLLPSAVLLLACIAFIPACKKKNTDGGGGGGNDTPANVNTEHVLFAHMKVKDVLDSSLFAEVKKAFAKEGGDLWDKAEQEVAKELGGIKPTDIDSVTVCVAEVPERDMPKFIVILSANKAIDKAGVAKIGKSMPDPRGFYRVNEALAHFPDNKTIVLLHPALADKYLAGYAKDRSAWPMTADLKAAADGHTLFVVADVTKVPTKMFGQAEAQEFGSLLSAQKVTLTADLKGKEISAAVRATFPSADAAAKAKDTVQKYAGMASELVNQFATGKEAENMRSFAPAIKEAQRALKDLKLEVSGSDLIVAGSYKIDFDIGTVMADAVKRVREAADRTKANNNFKQIGIALHNYHSTYGTIVIHGIGPKGAPLANATQKPLLSWRVAMLPYIEQENLYREFKLDEPWDSEHNKKLIEKMPKVFEPLGKPTKPGYTHTQMVIGPNAMQPPTVSFAGSFPDGTSNTIAVVEAADPVIWTKPDDVMLPGNELPKDLKKKFGGIFPGGFHVGLWDGSARFVKDTISDRTLGSALNPRDGQPLGSDW